VALLKKSRQHSVYTKQVSWVFPPHTCRVKPWLLCGMRCGLTNQRNDSNVKVWGREYTPQLNRDKRTQALWMSRGYLPHSDWEYLQSLYISSSIHYFLNQILFYVTFLPIRVVAGSKAWTWTVFAHSNTGIVGSIPTRSMDVCVRLLSWPGCTALFKAISENKYKTKHSLW
jgi:hypothetical protein